MSRDRLGGRHICVQIEAYAVCLGEVRSQPRKETQQFATTDDKACFPAASLPLAGNGGLGPSLDGTSG